MRAYNVKTGAHNAQIENQRRRLNQEIGRLNSHPVGDALRRLPRIGRDPHSNIHGDGASEDDPTEEELRHASMQAERATFGKD